MRYEYFNDWDRFWFSDHIDVVRETLYSADYVREEDPKLFVSEKTNRGPLADSWLDEHWNEVCFICTVNCVVF